MLDSAWGPTDGVGAYQWVTPIVFTSLAPRFREQNRDARKLSPTSLAIIKLLVERGAALDPDPRSSFWASHLLTEVCRDYDSPEALDLLVRAGADVYTEQLDSYHRTLLHVAAGRGVGAVQFLLDRGVPMNYTGGQDIDAQIELTINGSPLNWAAENGRSQIAQLLLNHGALRHMETLDWNGRTPLLNAARSPHVPCVRGNDREETVRLLIDAGANLTVSDQQYHTWSFIHGEPDFFPDSPLGHVSAWGSADIVRYLVGKGCNIHQQLSYPTDERFPYSVGGDMATPQHRAASNWNVGAVQALLDLGADPDAMDEYDRRPIHWAAIGRCLGWGSYRTISRAWDNLQTEPSQSAAFSERLTALKSTLSHLLAQTASIDQPDTFGHTPLHYAACIELGHAKCRWNRPSLAYSGVDCFCFSVSALRFGCI
jgi:ankyrin repeat protein